MSHWQELCHNETETLKIMSPHEICIKICTIFVLFVSFVPYAFRSLRHISGDTFQHATVNVSNDELGFK